MVCSIPEVFGAVARALPRGSVAFQVREKDLSADALVRLVAEVVAEVRPFGAKVFVNDRLDVALAAEADGVHLSTRSVPVSRAARLVPLLGASTHSWEEIKEAEGASFLVFGPVFATPSKASYGPPLGLSALEGAARSAPAPVYALGGITRERVVEVIRRGAAGVALISAVLAAKDPVAEARALWEEIEKARAYCEDFCKK